LRFVYGEQRCTVEEDCLNVFELLETAELRLGAKVKEDQLISDRRQVREGTPKHSEFLLKGAHRSFVGLSSG